jgi:hypothetical protein
MSKNKVAPRDVFNTANFLKCIAQMVLWIEKDDISNLAFTPSSVNEDWINFNIDESSGDFIPDRPLFYRTSDGEPLDLVRNMNSRAPWPVYIITEEFEEFESFDVDGNP